MSTEAPAKIAVAGAAGQIYYSLLFRIVSGFPLGDRPIELRLLEITPALKALGGVVIEPDDCAFSNLKNVVTGNDPKRALNGVDLMMLVGAIPYRAGMECGDPLSASGAIFIAQGKALNEIAADDIRVLVTGNPANTNALIASNNAPDILEKCFNALTRLDHNRAGSQLTQKFGYLVEKIKRMTIQGNHSSTQYPDTFHTEVSGRSVVRLVNDETWIGSASVPTVAKYDTTTIETYGLSSAASAANATVEHMCDWVLGTPDGDWVFMAIPSDGSYGVVEGVIFSFPCMVKDGKHGVVQGPEIDPFSRTKIDASVTKLFDGRKIVKEFSLI